MRSLSKSRSKLELPNCQFNLHTSLGSWNTFSSAAWFEPHQPLMIEWTHSEPLDHKSQYPRRCNLIRNSRQFERNRKHERTIPIGNIRWRTRRTLISNQFMIFLQLLLLTFLWVGKEQQESLKISCFRFFGFCYYCCPLRVGWEICWFDKPELWEDVGLGRTFTCVYYSCRLSRIPFVTCKLIGKWFNYSTVNTLRERHSLSLVS